MAMARRDESIRRIRCCSQYIKQLMDLPVDTLFDILVRLPAKSIGRIRCVSKSLLQMVNHTSFYTLHTRSLFSTNCNSAVDDHVPRFMFYFRNHLFHIASMSLQSVEYNHNTNTNTLAKGRYAINLPSSDSYLECFSLHNLFLLGFNGGDCMLINVLGDREVLRLPTGSIRTTSNYRCSFGMGYDTKTNTYKIVRVRYEHLGYTNDDVMMRYRFLFLETHVLVLGTNSWREIPSVPPCVLYGMDKICANGDMHWLKRNIFDGGDERSGRRRRRGDIVSFDFTSEEFYWTPSPPTLSNSDSSTTTLHLFTLRGCLAIGATSSSGRFSLDIEIWVLKEKQWVRHYGIKNKTIESFDHSGDIMVRRNDFYDRFREWEHGICFTTNVFIGGKTTTVFFLDLRDGSVNRVAYSSWRNDQFYMGLISYHESLLISLRNYGNLDDFED